MTFLTAVAREEGFYVVGTRSQRNNNPGDIEWGKFTAAHGAINGDPRFAIFPDAATGFAAMKALFQGPAYKGLTVAEALNKWAPGLENDTQKYIQNVCSWVPCQPTDVIDGLLG
jgi:hypothetical protein